MFLYPSKAERAMTRFLIPKIGFGWRFIIATILFLVATISAIWFSGFVALVLLVLGHLVLWVKRQKLAPGGATPIHDQSWVPTEIDWFDRVKDLEKKGKRWDLSFFDISNLLGGASFIFFAFGFFLIFGFAVMYGEAAIAFTFTIAAIFLPQWLNGMTSPWHPSELFIKGEAIKKAIKIAELDWPGRFEQVPMLALAEGKKGKYPVDARLLLRPTEKNTELIGVQIQVCINNVQGKDYPYLYCVVLSKKGNTIKSKDLGKNIVIEKGAEGDVKFLVIRQKAGKTFGWETKDPMINSLVSGALEIATESL